MTDESELSVRLARYKTALFSGLYDADAARRALAIDHILRAVQTWAGHSAPDTDADRLLRDHLLVMVRMSVNCPFEDVRARFRQCLDGLHHAPVAAVPRPLHTSPSFFIPADKVIPLTGAVGASHLRVMQACFLENGRLSHVHRLMAYFPEYLERFLRTFNHVLRLQGPLPRPWRHYIAIMAAAQHQCQYLVTVHSNEFLMSGGDALWLSGLTAAPQKLQNLAELNSILCHQPWTLTREHVGGLLRGADSWSKSELVQAMVLMATFYSLSSFVLGCGVVPEIDMAGGVLPEGTTKTPAADWDYHEEDDEELLQQTKQLIQRLTNQGPTDDPATSQDVFESCDTQENEAVIGGRPRSGVAPPPTTGPEQSFNFILEDMKRFLGSHDLQHTDFDVKSPLYSIFRLQDYNWEEHGCSLVSKYLPETGELLDEEFSAILNLTDYSLFNSKTESGEEKTMDTWPFRQAVWYYVLRLTGMSHDDYNYHEVNIYLNRQIKNYIKKVVCFPEKIVPSDFRMGFSFRNDEKCHINLLAAEARKCAVLLYGLHAVMKYER